MSTFSACKPKKTVQFLLSWITQRTVQGGGEEKKLNEAKRLSKLAIQGEDKTIPCKHCLCGDIFKVSQSPLFLKSLSSEITKAI